jgi:DNA-binding NarL/FixJ family response regulator
VINNITKLEGFIAEFKMKQQTLIKQAEENRIVKPWIKQNEVIPVKLTAKEKLVAQYYSRGVSAKNIACAMGIKEKTVFNYLETIKDKYLLIDCREKESLINKLRLDYTLFHG